MSKQSFYEIQVVERVWHSRWSEEALERTQQLNDLLSNHPRVPAIRGKE